MARPARYLRDIPPDSSARQRDNSRFWHHFDSLSLRLSIWLKISTGGGLQPSSAGFPAGSPRQFILLSACFKRTYFTRTPPPNFGTPLALYGSASLKSPGAQKQTHSAAGTRKAPRSCGCDVGAAADNDSGSGGRFQNAMSKVCCLTSAVHGSGRRRARAAVCRGSRRRTHRPSSGLRLRLLPVHSVRLCTLRLLGP